MSDCQFCGRKYAEFAEQHRDGLFYKRGNGGMVYTGPGDHCQYYAWMTGGDAGTSSKTIVESLTGALVLGSSHPYPPRDGADFGRCLRMLDTFPWLRAGLHRLPELHSSWPKWLVDEQWAELEQLCRDRGPKALGTLSARLAFAARPEWTPDWPVES